MRKKVFLIEVRQSMPSFGKIVVIPRSGILTIASILAEKTDYDVTLLYEPFVGPIDVARIADNKPVYILLNGLTTTADENEALIARLREVSTHPFVVIAGGEHATMLPGEAQKYADFIVLHEGDETIIRLLYALDRGDKAKIAAIPSIIYKDTDGWHGNIKTNVAPRVKNIDYRYDFTIMPGAKGIAGKSIRMHGKQIPIQTSRGCYHNCSFCSWISLFGGRGYYTRPIDDVIYDIEHTVDYTGIQNFMITDNLFGGDIDYTAELLRRIIKTYEFHPQKPNFTVLMRADQFFGKRALPDEILKLMREAGIDYVSLGLESVSNSTLKQMGKHSDIEMYERAAQHLHSYGFRLSATFVSGSGDETYQDVLNVGDFAAHIGCASIQIYCYTVTPDTLDFSDNSHLMIPIPNKYCNGHAVGVFPRRMLPSTLQKAVFEAADIFSKRSSQGLQRLVGRIYRRIWQGVKPYYDCMRQLEEEYLIPEGIYIPDGQGNYILQEEKLLEKDAKTVLLQKFALSLGEKQIAM